jgi:hypothetical protein
MHEFGRGLARPGKDFRTPPAVTRIERIDVRWDPGVWRIKFMRAPGTAQSRFVESSKKGRERFAFAGSSFDRSL